MKLIRTLVALTLLTNVGLGIALYNVHDDLNSEISDVYHRVNKAIDAAEDAESAANDAASYAEDAEYQARQAKNYASDAYDYVQWLN